VRRAACQRTPRERRDSEGFWQDVYAAAAEGTTIPIPHACANCETGNVCKRKRQLVATSTVALTRKTVLHARHVGACWAATTGSSNADANSEKQLR